MLRNRFLKYLNQADCKSTLQFKITLKKRDKLICFITCLCPFVKIKSLS